MKIQINSLEALERLIGGDTDVEIQIRNSVVQNFTNKHLKGIATTYLENGYLKALETTISNDVFEKVSGWSDSYKFKTAYKDAATRLIKDLIEKEIREQLQLLCTKDKLEKLVESALSYQVTVQVNEITKTLIEEEAKKQIKAKFG